MEDQLSGGTIATMIIVPILLLIVLAGTIFAFVMWRKITEEFDERYQKDSDARSAFWSGVAGVVTMLAIIALTWWSMYPWSYEYHHWVVKTGVVATADSRQISDGDHGMQTKFVITYASDPLQQYGVVDTRAATLKPGDTATITCKREWQFSGTDGYDCNFVDYKPGKR